MDKENQQKMIYYFYLMNKLATKSVQKQTDFWVYLMFLEALVAGLWRWIEAACRR